MPLLFRSLRPVLRPCHVSHRGGEVPPFLSFVPGSVLFSAIAFPRPSPSPDRKRKAYLGSKDSRLEMSRPSARSVARTCPPAPASPPGFREVTGMAARLPGAGLGALLSQPPWPCGHPLNPHLPLGAA